MRKSDPAVSTETVPEKYNVTVRLTRYCQVLAQRPGPFSSRIKCDPLFQSHLTLKLLWLCSITYPGNMSTSDAESGTRPVYKVYKRRFWGLAQLVLLNIVVSWDVCAEA